LGDNFRGNAGSRVVDFKMQAGRRAIGGAAANVDRDTARFGELDRIIDQMTEHLAEPQGISQPGALDILGFYLQG